MRDRSELGVHAICCLLHNLTPGGSGWQWINLLGRHVEHGGRATIFAPTGPLAEPARAAGIEVVPTSWDRTERAGRRHMHASVGEHEAAIVHWDHGVMETFEPALEACGRAALALHQAPYALARWFGPQAVVNARSVLERALSEKHAVALVRGQAHRQRVVAAFGTPPEGLRILPASIPLPAAPFRPQQGAPTRILALMRLSPEKAPVGLLAIELVRERLAAGNRCQLTIAGDGPWRSEAVALCERRLPPGAWEIEGAPADPSARLAAADVVVAQGLITLEAAALGRRVVVARSAGETGAQGVVLKPDRYDEAARDPFGRPDLTGDSAALWEDLLALDSEQLRATRRLVETHNSLDVASRALEGALTATANQRGPFGRLAGTLRG